MYILIGIFLCDRQCGSVERVLALESEDLDLDLGSALNCPCDLGQVATPQNLQNEGLGLG